MNLPIAVRSSAGEAKIWQESRAVCYSPSLALGSDEIRTRNLMRRWTPAAVTKQRQQVAAADGGDRERMESAKRSINRGSVRSSLFPKRKPFFLSLIYEARIRVFDSWRLRRTVVRIHLLLWVGFVSHGHATVRWISTARCDTCRSHDESEAANITRDSCACSGDRGILEAGPAGRSWV